jgi:hypothetical protein
MRAHSHAIPAGQKKSVTLETLELRVRRLKAALVIAGLLASGGIALVAGKFLNSHSNSDLAAASAPKADIASAPVPSAKTAPAPTSIADLAAPPTPPPKLAAQPKQAAGVDTMAVGAIHKHKKSTHKARKAAIPPAH